MHPNTWLQRDSAQSSKPASQKCLWGHFPLPCQQPIPIGSYYHTPAASLVQAPNPPPPKAGVSMHMAGNSRKGKKKS
ncbi:hypothetical protein BGZ63DRAFT_394434 [Mariannaea sp. PMI_226]|nr:hypothetical protein BGZ63DRAFT_394434 [Mariannaea sp. PMI_226]